MTFWDKIAEFIESASGAPLPPGPTLDEFELMYLKTCVIFHAYHTWPESRNEYIGLPGDPWRDLLDNGCTIAELHALIWGV